MPLPLYYYDANGWYMSQGFFATEYERTQAMARNPRATVHEPPAQEPGTRPRFVAGAWALEAWPPERPIEQVRSLLIDRAQAIRDAGIRSGFTWNGHRFDSDMVAQQRISGLAVLASTPAYPAEGVSWRLADNSWITLDATDAMSVFAAGAAHVQAWFAAFAAHEAAILALETSQQADQYDVEANWPGQ